ncbi:MAG: DUF1080 domain-containing protein [Blastocatellia bacterium]
MYRITKLTCAALLAVILVAPCAIAGGKNGKWIELFNGKDTTGWRHIGPGEFFVEDGALVSKGGMGMLYYEARKFRNFTLEIEWKANHKCNNSGIFVRFPDNSDDPMYAVNNGYEIQICDCDKQGLTYETGAIYSFHPATKIASKNAGEWNLYQITVTGQHYTVVLNGEKVNEFDGTRGLEGYIGLQNHDIISRVSFRRVRVKENK